MGWRGIWLSCGRPQSRGGNSAPWKSKTHYSRCPSWLDCPQTDITSILSFQRHRYHQPLCPQLPWYFILPGHGVLDLGCSWDSSPVWRKLYFCHAAIRGQSRPLIPDTTKSWLSDRRPYLTSQGHHINKFCGLLAPMSPPTDGDFTFFSPPPQFCFMNRLFFCLPSFTVIDLWSRDWQHSDLRSQSHYCAPDQHQTIIALAHMVIPLIFSRKRGFSPHASCCLGWLYLHKWCTPYWPKPLLGGR